MEVKTLEEYALFHKSLAEPIRLRVLALLNARESLCVCDLVSVLELSQSTVSRHLAYLKNKGLVDSWREGTWIHYSIKKKHFSFSVLQASLQALDDLDVVKADKDRLEVYEQSCRLCGIN
jgi:ArsR family transcriptional regulator